MDFLEHYVFNFSSKVWHLRKKGFVIGCMYYCNLFVREKFYMQLLLTVVQGSQSFEHLRIVNGITYDTFREACVALGLTLNDQEWLDTFAEAVIFALGKALQRLLVTAMVHGDFANEQNI